MSTDAPKAPRSRRLDSYNPDSHAPATRPLVDADAYLAATEDQAANPAPAGALEDQAARELAPRRAYAPEPLPRELPWGRTRVGRGTDPRIPDVADVLDRRRVTRSNLHLSVPADLHLEDRMRDFLYANRGAIPGDVLAVALDDFFRRNGY